MYGPLSEAQLDKMRQRRLSCNCSAEKLIGKQFDAHQTKHIMICSGASCKAACSSCGSCGSQTGERAWEYLNKRLKVNSVEAVGCRVFRTAVLSLAVVAVALHGLFVTTN